mmetsp:Transcript_1664/g.2473  ORF Transcript_1664/g.2473 Transcript_1664/m.2473 type:complete len:222 (-) Transcript_1664:34-699(-)|eukprot:CAMPEP_0197234300 /NCGR_PEP_ID=MMETSP1429-20130617/2072_1 /TAXON_ID=49237 /ORGANISM="Chaetoceros  sp., Strain UNC1202" /LENGTH=221 /DNA_ID=CAMNT_0042692667 /DNA_START=49 /DNA_END=714 /DNA_ORIENTATION=-
MGIVFGKTGVVEPSFDLLLSRSASNLPYEIRRYGNRYACETQISMNGKDGNSGGFRALAGYIGVGGAPKNDGGVSVAMTAPVVTEKAGGGTPIAMTAPVVMENSGDSKKMQFILPAEYDSLDKIPKPTSPNVKITEVPAATGAVHTFSGSCDDQKAQVHIKKLVEQLKNDGVDLDEKKAIDEFSLWQYHPPFTLPFCRRNEVWLDLSPEQVDDLLKKYKEP